MRDGIYTRMQHDEIYQDVYRNNDLLTMWEALDDYCAAGSIKSVQNRIQARVRFMKLYQHDAMSYQNYASTFSLKLKQLEIFNLT